MYVYSTIGGVGNEKRNNDDHRKDKNAEDPCAREVVAVVKFFEAFVGKRGHCTIKI